MCGRKATGGSNPPLSALLNIRGGLAKLVRSWSNSPRPFKISPLSYALPDPFHPDESDASRVVLGWALARYKFAKQFLTPAVRVVDAGCGSGFGAAVLGNYCASYVGIDEKTVIDLVVARGRYQGTNIKFVSADLNDNFPPLLPSPTLIIAFEMIEHLANPRFFLGNAHDLLAGSGAKSSSMLLTTPLNPNGVPYQKSDHLKEYSRPALEQELEESGFQILETWSWGIPFGALSRRLARAGKPIFRSGFEVPRTRLSLVGDWVPGLAKLTYLPSKYGLFGSWGVSQMILARPN